MCEIVIAAMGTSSCNQLSPFPEFFNRQGHEIVDFQIARRCLAMTNSMRSACTDQVARFQSRAPTIVD
jgi:hypothetical protein